MEWKIPESEPYKKRISRSLLINALVSLFIAVIVHAAVKSWVWGFGIGLFLYSIQFLKATNRNKSFITVIRIQENEIEIQYTKEGLPFMLKGARTDFSFKKELAFNKTRTAFLAVYYKNILEIKQFESEAWRESLFDQVLAAAV